MEIRFGIKPIPIWIVVGRRGFTAGGAAAPPYRIWIVVGRWCPAAGGTAAPPYRGFGLLDEWRSGSSALPCRYLDIGRAAVPRRQRSSSSALPGVWFVGRMAERQLRPTLPIWIVVGRRCPAASGAAVPPYRGFGLLDEWRSGSSALPDLDCGGVTVFRPTDKRNKKAPDCSGAL
jgi:hypothetical protein